MVKWKVCLCAPLNTLISFPKKDSPIKCYYEVLLGYLFRYVVPINTIKIHCLNLFVFIFSKKTNNCLAKNYTNCMLKYTEHNPDASKCVYCLKINTI